MRNIARGSVLAILVALLLVGFTYFQPKAQAVTVEAKDSPESIQAEFNKTDLDSNNIEKYDFNITIDNTATGGDEDGDEDSEEEEAGNEGSSARAFKATAYCLRGKTASGRAVRRGIVAADSRILPLGTRIHLTGGKYTGNYTVADTGGRIRGRVLDIWVPSCAEARSWGRRTVNVKVLGKKKRKKTEE